jgi:hypothetical protein
MMLSRRRKPNELLSQFTPLLLLGMGLAASNRFVSFLDGESRTLDAAAQPLRAIAASLLAPLARTDVSPLLGMILHFWLHWTAWSAEYFRVPSIAFYLAGLFFLARCATRLAGPSAASAVIWLGILWPFGFHYGRLAAPYAFEFFLVAGVMFAYLRCIENESAKRAAWLIIFGAALVWTHLLGWVVLVCLGMDQALRHKSGERTLTFSFAARIALIWILVFLPVARSLFLGFRLAMHVPRSFPALLAGFTLPVYNLFASESVAPWYWQYSVPAALAAAAGIFLVFYLGTAASRRYLVYSALLVLVMGLAGLTQAGLLFLAAPWLLVGIAAGIASIESKWGRPALAACLLLVGAIGWYGIYERRFYQTPQFVEPWAQVTADAVSKLPGGATIISDSRAFFLYLTIALRSPVPQRAATPEGLLPDTLRYPNVMSIEQWTVSDRKKASTLIWIHEAGNPDTENAMQNVADDFDKACGARTSRLLARDAGFNWKERYAPSRATARWLIEVREYDCASSNTQEIFPLPSK